MSQLDAITDVVELCALLQCIGFSVKSLDTSGINLSQDGGAAAKTVVINCHSSGIHVVLESEAGSCSCPTTDQQNSSFWQVSGTAGGKRQDTEYGSVLLRAVPKPHRDRLSKQLYDMIRCIRALNYIEDGSKLLNKSTSMADLASKSASFADLVNKTGSLGDLSKEGNRSASVLELATPEKRDLHLKAENPTRYRSLDTLTAIKDNQPLNTPLSEKSSLKKTMVHRQSTYTICLTTPRSVISRTRNKTSSPIQTSSNSVLDNLIEAEKEAENLRNKLSVVIKDYMDDGKHNSSISSMLDVSKISPKKGQESKAQFVSSPNLSGLVTVHEDLPITKLKRFQSASTSYLAKPTSESIGSKLRRISPNIFKAKKDSSIAKEKGNGKSKLQNIFKPRVVTPVRVPNTNTPPSSFIDSASKKKYNHIKSTIPRPTNTKKE